MNIDQSEVRLAIDAVLQTSNSTAEQIEYLEELSQSARDQLQSDGATMTDQEIERAFFDAHILDAFEAALFLSNRAATRTGQLDTEGYFDAAFDVLHFSLRRYFEQPGIKKSSLHEILRRNTKRRYTELTGQTGISPPNSFKDWNAEPDEATPSRENSEPDNVKPKPKKQAPRPTKAPVPTENKHTPEQKPLKISADQLRSLAPKFASLAERLLAVYEKFPDVNSAFLKVPPEQRATVAKQLGIARTELHGRLATSLQSDYRSLFALEVYLKQNQLATKEAIEAVTKEVQRISETGQRPTPETTFKLIRDGWFDIGEAAKLLKS